MFFDKKIQSLFQSINSFYKGGVHICRVANGDLTWENLSYPKSHISTLEGPSSISCEQYLDRTLGKFPPPYMDPTFSLIQPNVHEGLFALASGLMMRTFYVQSNWVIALYYWYIMKENHMSVSFGINTMFYEYITDGRHVWEQISISCIFCPNTLEVSCVLTLDPQVITYGKYFYRSMCFHNHQELSICIKSNHINYLGLYNYDIT